MRTSALGTGVVAAALLVIATAGPALAEEVMLSGSGSGADEVPDPGEEGATISGDLTVDTEAGTITYTVKVAGNAEPAAAAHIHEAPEGTAGPVVVPLDVAAVNAGTQATATVDAALAAEIAESPEDYYLNAHSPSFSNGFARGQLADSSPTSVPAGDGSSAGSATTLLGLGLLSAGGAAVTWGVLRRRQGLAGA